MSTPAQIQQISVDDLHFDRSNPRLAEYGILPTTSDEDILEVLWEAMDVMELVQSIGASGFFPHEALIVTKEGGRLVVIEGNRRLAAVKVLRNPRLAAAKGWQVPTLSATQLDRLAQVPAIIAGRKDSWRFLGFKHVNGPAKWTSYAKAAYIAHVHRSFGVPLSDIAGQIGDRHNTVQRLFRGLMVLEQAERLRVFDREDRFRQKLAFSHLYTGLDYDGIASFIEVSPKEAETPDPVPESRKEELGELMVWLYGSRKEKREPVVQSQNPDLRRLNAVVADRESLSALRSGVDLAKAFEISEPPAVLFEEALITAKRQLTTARAYLTTGDDGSESLLKLAGTVAELSADIYDELERKRRAGGPRRKFITEG
jgi:hypothetical protein